jgi:signal transduction histidine kinase
MSKAGLDFRVLFEKTPDLYLVLDPNFFIIAATDAFLSATATRREDVVGQHLFDVFPETPPASSSVGQERPVCTLRDSLQRALRDRVPDTLGVQRRSIQGPGGEREERYWSLVNTPVLGPGGRVAYIIHSAEDMTETVRLKKSAEEQRRAQSERVATMETEILSRSEELGATYQQLKAANEELAARTAELHNSLETMQTFTYTIAHDLRAPLRALTSFSALVMQECAGDLNDFGKDCLHRINGAALRMDRLVTDLLAYGQLTHLEVTTVPISLNDAVTKVLQDLASEIRGRSAAVEVEHPLPSAIANLGLVNQVLLNLIDNALKFVPRDRTPRIRIYTQRMDNRLRLRISDNGIGVPPQYHTRIFDLFVRLHKSTEYSGTGIGLALVKKAMERMMGRVGLESTPGEGSTFWLEFRAAV